MSRLHRGRKLLKERLYEHAVSLGIIAEPEAVDQSEPVDLNAYRSKRRAV